MEHNKPKPKRYLETKFSRAASVVMTANRYKNSPKDLADFIENNITYFPNVDDDILDKLRIGSVGNVTSRNFDIDNVGGNKNTFIEIPKFAELNSEENKNR